MESLTLTLEPILKLNPDQFYEICQRNPDLKLELTAQGELILMPPTGGETGRQNSDLNFQFQLWNRQYQFGEVFDSSTAFILPNGATRSPDVSWITKACWEALTPQEKEKFVPLCPDFVLELLSPTDPIARTRQKMAEYMDNGCRLGWLINRKAKQVEIYRPDTPPEILDAPQHLSGETVLQGFVLDLSQMMTPAYSNPK